MLVLNRKVGEAVVALLPGRRPVIIRVQEIRRGQVKLAIEADPALPVHRGEIAARVAKAPKGQGVER